MTSLNLGRLLILNLEGRIRISCTRGCLADCIITRLERNGVGTVIQGCLCTKCRTVQRQSIACSVQNLHTNACCATCSRTLQSQYVRMISINCGTKEGNSCFVCNSSVTIVQLNVKTDSRTGCSFLCQRCGTNLP